MAQQVLLVDDEKDFLEALAARMTAREIKVSTASTVEEAIMLIGHNRYDAIILDFQMPGIDGMEALSMIKAKQNDSHIILLSGYATVEKEMEAMQMGASIMIEKPPDLDILMQIIRLANIKIKQTN